MKIGIVGTGAMGKPLVHNLQKAGHQLYVWNRTKAKAESLLQGGAVWCEQPAEVARRAEIVGLVLATHEAAREVFHGPEGLLAGVHTELWVVDHGTNPASWALEAQALVASGKGRYVDAPVMGSRPQAAAASLVVAAGTTKTASEKLVTYLEAIGSQVVWTGEVARGARLKLAINLYLALTTTALAESLSLATASGLEPQVFLEALNAGALASPYLKLKGAKLARQDYSPQFTLSLMHKDLRLIEAEASGTGTPLFVGGVPPWPCLRWPSAWTWVRRIWQRFGRSTKGSENEGCIHRTRSHGLPHGGPFGRTLRDPGAQPHPSQG